LKKLYKILGNDRSVIYLCVVKSGKMTKGEETRQFIIECSAPIFNRKGLAATAMSDIMEATRLSKGSLYVHFENKDVLAHTAVDHNLELLGSKLMAVLNKCKTAKDKLFAYLDLFEDPLHPPVAGGCPMLNFGMEADETNPVVKDKVNRVVELSQQIIADLIKEGIKKGEFKSTWNYRDFATLMFASIEGGNLICRVGGNNHKMKIITSNLKKMISEQLV
jgi:TetR/AcrR family transcriptional regulator, transcriptional repressor for nem operon